MWLPPYFGDYTTLLRALLNDPTLGSGQTGHHYAVKGPGPHDLASSYPGLGPEYGGCGYPHPKPWHAATEYLVSLVSTKEAAAQMSNNVAAQQVVAAADAGISQFLDDYCSPPFVIGWPYPGPPPLGSMIASELAKVANTFEQGALRAGLLKLAGRVLDAAYAAPDAQR